MPDGTTQLDAEGYVAAAVAWYFALRSLPGNALCSMVRNEPGKVLGAVTTPRQLP